MKNRENELECILFFMPECLKKIKITDEDKRKYFEWSEKGRHKNDIRLSNFDDGFSALVSSKKWRGITVHELWEKGLTEGSFEYWDILGGADKMEILPRSVVDFIKNELFKGTESEKIEKIYNEVLETQNYEKK